MLISCLLTPHSPNKKDLITFSKKLLKTLSKLTRFLLVSMATLNSAAFFTFKNHNKVKSFDIFWQKVHGQHEDIAAASVTSATQKVVNKATSDHIKGWN